MKVVLNTCGKELGGKIKSSMKSIPRIDFKTSKSYALIGKLETYIKYLEKNSI